MRAKIIGVSVAVILSLAAILLVSTVPYFILDDIPIEAKEYTSQKIVRTLTPTETILVPEIYTSEIKEIKSSSIVETMSEPSLSAQSFPFEAFAIGTTVDRINFQKYTDFGVGDKQYAFDSNHNFFSSRDTKITYFDRGLNTKTTWNLPELGTERGFGMTTDSAGNVYFGQDDNILTKLVPLEDTFIQVRIPTSQFQFDSLEVSSSGEVFFQTTFRVGKVNFDTGDITFWSPPAGILDMAIDSNDNMYFVQAVNINEFLFRLNPNTSELTSWFLNNNGGNAQALAIDNNDNIFIYQNGGLSHGRIQKVDTINNVLEEWVVPTTGFQVVSTRIAVDSVSTVYFQDFLTRLVPSTGEFTQWKLFLNFREVHHIDVDSNDDLWIAGSTKNAFTPGWFGKITAP